MKLTGPMMSVGASGSFGGVMVASIWKGRPYMRQLVKPSNPKSAAQVSNRAMMKFLSQAWAGLTSLEKASWEIDAENKKVSPFNAFTSYNMNRWSHWDTPTKDASTPSTAFTVTYTTFTATGGIRQVTLALNIEATADDDIWGAEIHRSTSSSFTPSKSTVIGCIELESEVAASYVDSPLAAGTYYYKCIAFGALGVNAAASSEVNATVT